MLTGTVSFLTPRLAPPSRRPSASSVTRRPPPLRRAHRVVWTDDRLRRLEKVTLSGAVAESTSSPEVENSPIDEIVKYLTTLGWEKAWIDGVTERIAKKQLRTTPATVKASCEYLLGLGISEGQLCNMVSLCFSILGYEVEGHLKPIISFLTTKGVSNLPKLLTMQPKLLDYTVSQDNSVLEKGKLRASIKVEKKGEDEVVGVVIYREGAAFNTAPLTPYSP